VIKTVITIAHRSPFPHFFTLSHPMNFRLSRRHHWSVWLSVALAALAIVMIAARVQAGGVMSRFHDPSIALDAASCSLNGITLYGKVQIVDSFPDLKVKRVDSFPDLNVQWVDSFPDQCGKWQEVRSFPDFTIQYVDSFPDLEMKEVTSFPGVA
jgi:hypothetical protein